MIKFLKELFGIYDKPTTQKAEPKIESKAKPKTTKPAAPKATKAKAKTAKGKTGGRK